jgi:hypothetical protein
MPIFDDNIRRIMRMQNIMGNGAPLGNDLPEQGGIMGNMRGPGTPGGSYGNSRPTGNVMSALKGGDFSSSKRYSMGGENTFGTGRTGSVVDQNDDNDYDIHTRMQELYHPSNQIQDRYIKALDEMPTRNKPGIVRKIVATVGAAGSHGRQNVDNILYGPYNRQMADWTKRIGPLHEGAELERSNNTNLRGIASSVISQEMADRRIDRQIRRDRVLEDQGTSRIRQGDERIHQGDERIAQGNAAGVRADARLKIAQDVAKGGQLKLDDAGTLRMYYRDGTSREVDGQFLTAEEKNDLITQRQKDVNASRPGATRDRVETAVVDDPDNPGHTIAVIINKDTGEVKKAKITKEGTTERVPVTPTVKDSSLEQGRGITQKAQQVKAQNSAWSKYIKIDKQGKVSITTPGIFSGPSQGDYDKIYQSIYGDTQPAPAQRTPSRMGGPGPGARNGQAIPPEGFVRVTGPKGEKGRMSLQEWKSKDWTKEGWRMTQ